MQLSILHLAARTVTIQLDDGGLYNTTVPYDLYLNGEFWVHADTVVTTLYYMEPDTDYVLEVRSGDAAVGSLCFHTAWESYTMDVRDFGAVGDGKHDDTAAIQAAISCCPAQGRVLIPAGDYSVLPLFLKSHITLELQYGATLLLNTDRSRFPILPGMTLSTDETDDYNLGSWEGNPLDTFASFLTGVEVEDVLICGEGVLDGQAQLSDWWVDHRTRRGAWRPRMLFLARCRRVVMQGLTVRNSPCWNLQPYFSQDLGFYNLFIQAPANSPNTDGFDPESCTHIRMAGTHFSVGDDCIALKSGKLYMGRRYKTPISDVEISHCLMEDGHGGVTIGSEIAGGAHDITVHHCVMRHTDRGLRIKTRRGRGRDSVIDGVTFDHVVMEHVGTPLVVNALYYCDPDGKSDYVQSREKQPVDARTPHVGTICFRDVQASDVTCAAYILGLPEEPVEHVVMQNVTISCDPDAAPMVPAMACGVEPCKQTGIVAINVDEVTLDNVIITGAVE